MPACRLLGFESPIHYQEFEQQTRPASHRYHGEGDVPHGGPPSYPLPSFPPTLNAMEKLTKVFGLTIESRTAAPRAALGAPMVERQNPALKKNE